MGRKCMLCPNDLPDEIAKNYCPECEENTPKTEMRVILPDPPVLHRTEIPV